MKPEHHDIAMQCVLLSAAPEDVRDILLKNARTCEFSRGSTIFLQGEPATAIYLVIEGWVKLCRITTGGTEAVVGVFTKGRSFGEAAALRNDIYPVNAEAVTDCTLLRIDAAVFLRELNERPGLAVSILSATFAHLHHLVSQVEQLKAQTGTQRVAEFLLDLCQTQEGPCKVILPYDKALIAGRLGLKPESLSRTFAKLRDYGVVIEKNCAKIKDVVRLRQYAEGDE